MPPKSSYSHIRRAQIVSLSLTELMLLLVFMAVAFSFLARKEGLVEVPRLQAQLSDAQRKVDALSAKNRDLVRQLAATSDELERLKRFLKRLNIDTATLTPSGDTLNFGPGITFVRSKTGGHAPGHPQCALERTYLLRIELLSDMRFRGEPLWDSKLESSVESLPGLAALASGKELTSVEFSTAAKALFDKSLQVDGCVFAVKAVRRTNDAGVFDAELLLVERYFDVNHS